MAYLEFRPEGPLYHYCSLEGMKGILSSKSLWLSDLSLTNDPREISFGLEKTLDAIRQVRHLELPGDQGVFLSVLWAKISGFYENIQIFTTCFTPFGDELPMWQQYTPQASGVAIGFRPRAITDMHGRLQKVDYIDLSDVQHLRSVIKAIAEIFPQSSGLHDDQFWLDAVSFAFARITSTKHSSWQHEKEVRLCYSQIKVPDNETTSPFRITSISPDGSEHRWRQPFNRVRDGSEIPYVVMPYGKSIGKGNDPTRGIAEVVLGPKCTASRDEVADYLTDQGFSHFIVRKSDCAIR